MHARTILIDDNASFRAVVRGLIESEPGLEVVGEGASGYDALDLVSNLQPDVIVMDVAMSKMGGIDATRELRARQFTGHVVALSMHDESVYVESMLQAGARAYVLKDCAAEELVPAIRAMLSGAKYFGSGVADPATSRGNRGHP